MSQSSHQNDQSIGILVALLLGGVLLAVLALGTFLFLGSTRVSTGPSAHTSIPASSSSSTMEAPGAHTSLEVDSTD